MAFWRRTKGGGTVALPLGAPRAGQLDITPPGIILISIILESIMNPFKYGQVVNAGDFCPRPELLKQLKSFVTSGQNVVLQGERRMGKTSLVCEALRQEKRHRMVYVDLLEIKTADDLGKRMIKAMVSAESGMGVLEKLMKSLARLRPSMSLDPITGQPSLSLDPRVPLRPDSIESILDLLKDIHKRHPVAVVFDEFQDILNLASSRETLALLRSKVQFQGDIAYIFAGSIRNRMSDIFTNSDSPFFKSAIAMDVGPLDTTSFSHFLEARYREGQRRVCHETIQEIISLAEAVPGDVQQFCGALWDTTSPKDTITDTAFPTALELIFSRESKGYESALVQITGQQLKCLTGLARFGGKSPTSSAFLENVGITLPASVKKALTRLTQLKIIYRHDREYKFVNPFFKRWLLWKNY